jgi:decaprenylphospho-beta-D-erythro-pentofuranosid-2-ulose 2-reductase
LKDAYGRFERVLLLGAASEIGQAITLAVLPEGRGHATLAGRAPKTIDATRLEAAGITIERTHFDALDLDSHETLFDQIFKGPDFDVVVVAFGVLGDQLQDERDVKSALPVAATNYLGAMSAIGHASQRLGSQGHGEIVVLSSVAAQRARRSNFVYGSSKAGIDAYAAGMQFVLEGTGVHLLIVRPGFVRTKMTAHLKAAPFATNADAVAAAVVKGLRENAAVVWVPGLLRFVMWVIRALPTRALQRL